MRNPSDWVVLGRFGRPQGLKGFIRVNSFSEPEQAILQYDPWYIRKEGLWEPLPLVSKMAQNKSILVQVAGYDQREQVALLTHAEIGITQSQLPKLPPGEFYWQDLLHMQVYQQNGSLLGQVADILPTGSNDVLIVSGEKRHLIPYIQDTYIVSVDLIQRKIIVDWDEHF